MTYDDALAVLRSWGGRDVTIHLEPEGTTMDGVLSALDGEGFFAVDAERTSGVALALFRDGFEEAALEGEALTIRQGLVTATVTCGGRRSGRD